jgi:hypothetical protein
MTLSRFVMASQCYRVQQKTSLSKKAMEALSVISYPLLVSVHTETVFLDVILRSKATKNLIVSGSAEILRFAQNDMK